MDEVLYERRGAVAWVTFNRPAARNALTFAMYERLGALCDEMAADASLRAAVFSGAGGRAFIAGTDIAEFRGFASGEDGVRYEKQLSSYIAKVERLPFPTIAAIAGPAAGGGAAIAAVCDLRIGSPSASFGVPIARTLGNCLTVDLLARLVALVGIARVKDVLFTARLVPAPELLAIGLLNEVTADEESLLPRAGELAATLCGYAPLTLQAVKEGLRRIQARLLPEEDCSDLVRLAYGSADFREGVSAFLAKRRPEWTGT